MITKKTVLILGAGASMDYDFPSGEELLQYIVNILKGKLFINNPFLMKSFIAFCVFHLTNKHTMRVQNIDQNKFKTLIESVNEFEEMIIRSNAASIDDFIDKIPSTKNELKIIGKILIALSISDYEQEEKLFFETEVIDQKHRYKGRTGEFTSSCIRLKRGWYNNLWNKIYAGDSIIDNLKNLTIISFNYDRSIEQYLFNSIRSMLHLSKQDAAIILNENLFIHHVYGQLGELDWQNKIITKNGYEPFKVRAALNNIEQNSRLNRINLKNPNLCFEQLEIHCGPTNKHLIDIETLCQIANNIRTYTEVRAERRYEIISSRMNEAKMIFFLGFGYHPENIKWLSQKELKGNTDVEYAGTIFNKGETLVVEIKNRLNGIFAVEANQNSSKYFKYGYKEHKIKEYLENVINIT